MKKERRKTVFFAADHGGFALKEKLKAYLMKQGYIINDLGTHSQERCDYPIFAFELAKKVAGKAGGCGILICKSGIGNSIVANRVPGVRAALCYNVKAARLSRQHNDSNVLVLGSLFANERLARRIARVWLNTEFEAGRHSRRLALIRKLEKNIR